MKVKNKLRLGFGFLFIVVLFFGVVSLFYINQISNSAKVILKDNYKSLSIARDLRKILDENNLPLNAAALKHFNDLLFKEEHNVTEPGEQRAVTQLRAAFNKLQQKPPLVDMLQAQKQARRCLRNIEMVNMQAIVHKNEMANTSVDEAILFLGLTGAFTFLVLFSFSVNFPSIISRPLNALLDGIREIGQKNYGKRLHFEHHDEFAEVADAFNLMAAKLNDWENSNLAAVVSDKRRIETIIEQMQDAIIGLNENKDILFMNDAARKTLNITDAKVTGQNVDELVKNNDLFKSILNEGAVKPFKIVLNGRELYFQLQSNDIVVPNIDGPKGTLQVVTRSAGKVYILKNITEFKERDEAKTNFIATISHELKTPIASIKMS